MPYKPKYCCQCGEKIERVDWKLWTSRRFCELCETDFGIYDKFRAAALGVGLLFGLYGLGSCLQTPEKPLNIAAQQTIQANAKSEPPKTFAQVSSNGDNIQAPMPAGNSAVPTKTPSAPPTANLKIKPAAKTIEAAEKVYFCGAPTRKGTMCSRRVKNNGRCWQHEGQAALLPQEKLIAVQ